MLSKEQIKSDLSAVLNKQGSTLEEFDNYLACTKLGFNPLSFVPKVLAVPELLGVLSFGAGAGIGLAGYGGYKALQDSDDQVRKHQAVKQKYDSAIQSLQQASLQKNNPNNAI